MTCQSTHKAKMIDPIIKIKEIISSQDQELSLSSKFPVTVYSERISSRSRLITDVRDFNIELPSWMSNCYGSQLAGLKDELSFSIQKIIVNGKAEGIRFYDPRFIVLRQPEVATIGRR